MIRPAGRVRKFQNFADRVGSSQDKVEFPRRESGRGSGGFESSWAGTDHPDPTRPARSETTVKALLVFFPFLRIMRMSDRYRSSCWPHALLGGKKKRYRYLSFSSMMAVPLPAVQFIGGNSGGSVEGGGVGLDVWSRVRRHGGYSRHRLDCNCIVVVLAERGSSGSDGSGGRGGRQTIAGSPSGRTEGQIDQTYTCNG